MKGTDKKRGRPCKNPDAVKSETAEACVTPTEKEAWKQHFEKLGKGISDGIRWAVAESIRAAK